MSTAVELLHDLRAAKVLVWAKEGGKLGFSADKTLGFPDELRERVRTARAELLAVLQRNGVDSAERAERTTFHRLPLAETGELRSIQRAMYLQSRMDELAGTYTIPLFVELPGADPQRAGQALRALLDGEPLLRMAVQEDLTYRILSTEDIPVETRQVSGVELDALREERARTALPLEGGRLLLPEVLVTEDAVVVGLTHHHLLSDAPSMYVLGERLAGLYAGTATPEQPSYVDYVAHQEVELRAEHYTQARERLTAKLAAANRPRLGRMRPGDNRAVTREDRLGLAELEALRGLAREHRVSLYSVLLTGLYSVLSTFAGGETGFVVAATVGNRPVEFESSVGPFITTLPVIPDYEPGADFATNVRRVHEEVVDLNQHHQLNLDVLAEGLPGGAADLLELVKVLFTFHNFREAPDQGGVPHRVLPYADIADKFGLTVIAKPEADGLLLTTTHAVARFEPGFVDAVTDAWLALLRAVPAHHGPLATLSLLDGPTRELITRENATEADLGDDVTAVELFHRQADRTPDNLAVVFREHRLTYRELDERANRLAHELIARGVRPGSLVCLLLERGQHLSVAVLAVLKAGGAYVPVDPGQPEDRVRFILADTATPVLLTDSTRASGYHNAVVVDTDPDQPSTRPEVALTSADLAYAIYTSGTTGRPKGVLIEHRGLVNRVRWMQRAYPITEADRVVQKTPYVFDVSVWELVWAHWYGAAIVFAEPEGHKDPEYLAGLIRREQVTVIHFVPSMLGAFLEALREPEALRSLRLLFASGEELKLEHVRAVHDRLPWVAPHNLYGPTEASIDVLAFDCTDRALDRVLIGRPIANTRAHVLNDQLQELPVYAVGELFLGGVGLARGYLNRPELTEERFVQAGERLYRTGDLVRRLPDGSLDYLGRNDFQVKIRGYRIELGEVESALTRLPGIRQAVVVVWGQNLAGYYVGSADPARLRAELNAVLPEYMVPAALVELTEVPLTVNGKLDRRALPEPVAAAATGVVEPRTGREAEVRAVCADALGRDGFGVTDDLTRLGMDSIVAIRLAARLRQRFGQAVAVREVFAARTVERLTALLASTESTVDVVAEQGRLSGAVPLLPIQSWFFDQEPPRREHWNQAFLIRVPELDLARLGTALGALFERHDALRLRFRTENDRIVQYYDEHAVPAGLAVLDVRTVSGEALQRSLTTWQRGFDLADGPLHAAGYLHGYADGSARVFLALHHLVVDAVSWRVLADDLHALYEGRELGAKGTSYREWAEAVAGYGCPDPEYWQRQLDGARDLGATDEPCSAELLLDAEATELLLGAANTAFRTTPEELLLTATGLALRELTGQAAHTVVLEGHGRDGLDLDVSGTVGWFTTLRPFRLDTGGAAPDLVGAVLAVKEALRAAPPAIGFGARHHELPDLWFNYLGQPGATDGDWQVLTDPAGQTMPGGMPGALSIFALVTGGRLRVTLDSRLGRERTARLADALDTALRQVLTGCAAHEPGGYTPSDLREVRGEADLPEPVLGLDPHGWFELTDIQQAYLLGRYGNYEIGNVANHVYAEHVYPHLDTARLERAINDLVAEADVLRTVFSLDRLRQRVLPAHEVPAYELAVRTYQRYSELLLEDVRDRLSHEVHDAERFPLFTFEVSVFPDRAVLHLGMDLITLDVRSRLTLLRRLHDLYTGTASPPLPQATFKDHQDHAALLRGSEWYRRDRAYWQAKLPTMPPRPGLPLRNSPDTVVHPRFGEHTIEVAPEVWQRFKARTSALGVSASAALLGLFGSILAHAAGTTELPITVTLANRVPLVPDVDRVLGNFTSTVLHHFTDQPRDAEALLRHTHDRLWEDIAHSLYPGVRVQRDLVRLHELDATKALSPIVFTGAVGEATREFARLPFLAEDEHLDRRRWGAQTSQAWIDLQAVESGDGFSSKWLYVEQLFHEDDIAHLNGLFVRLIGQLADGGTDLPRADYLRAADRELIEAANAFDREPSEDTLVSLIDRHDPASPAVIDAAGAHSYGDLVTDSAALAGALLGTEGSLVAVLADKGYHQVLATTAVLRAGLAYLPLHVDWPLERVAGILTESGTGTVLLTRAHAQRAEVRELGARFRLLVIEDHLDQAPVRLPEVRADDLAYVIFTSGSTGKPKGVTISHRGAMNTIHAVNERFQVTAADRVLALSELSFDLSVYDLFGLLAVGGTIVCPDQARTKDPAHWADLVQRHGVTLWNSVPQLAGLLAEEAAHLGSLRVVMMSGDWIPTTLPARLREVCPAAVVMSLGGATEGSIWSIWYEIGEVDPDWPSIPYGCAMPNQRVYVLTAAGEHCPVGVPGEIHIGGAGVALGYWRDPGLTAARYFTHPELGRLYRTGDLGCWREPGHIEFLGRTDFQVKLNGYRVELGEVEAALAACDGVAQSVAAVVRDRLVGYYVAERPLPEAALTAHLARRLPEYMVPEALVHLTALPLSPNGKLDRAALPEPDAPTTEGHLAPRDEGERRLRDLWAEVLGLPADRLGVRDDLLKLGVDSIVAIRVVGRLRRQLGLAVGVRDVFAHRTVEQFHQRFGHTTATEVRAEQGVLTGPLPTLPVQDWLLGQDLPEPAHWNQSFLIRVPALDPDRLADCVRQLVDHHDALRLRVADGLRYGTGSPGLRTADVSTVDDLDALLTEWQNGFDLADGPLCAFGYLHGYPDGSARVFVAVHHLAVDVLSWQLLTEDLHTLYQGGSLGEKSTSYRQWAEHVRTRFAEAVLPARHPEPLAPAGPARHLRLDFDAELTERLHRCQRVYGTGVDEFLLTALGLALAEVTGRSSWDVALEGHGRDEVSADLDLTRTVGWFTTLHPAHLALSADPVASLKTVKDSVRAAREHALAYGVAVGYTHPMPPVCLNYLGWLEDSGEPWSVTAEPAGTAVHPANELPYTLNLAGAVRGDRLELLVASKLSEEDTERLALALRGQLATLVALVGAETRTHLTASDIAHVLPQERLDELQATRELADVFAATSLQQGFIAHALRQGQADDAYRVQAVWDYHAAIDPDLLRQAWAHAQAQHACLRTGFDWAHDHVQVVAREARLDWRFTDLSGHPEPRREFSALVLADRETPYDLAQPGLFRLRLVKFGDRAYTCLLNTHHAILDGWSSPLLLDTVHTAYLRLLDGREPAAATEDYAACQRYLAAHAHEHTGFWRAHVADASGPADLGGLLRPEARGTDLGNHRRVERQNRRARLLPAHAATALRTAAAAEGVTPAAVFQYAWHRQLSVYGGTGTTVVGTVLSGRELPVDGIERAVGLFLSTVPLLVRHTAEATLAAEVQALQRDLHEASRRGTVDLAALEPAGRRLFDSLFIHENYPESANPEHTRELAPEFRWRHQKRDYPLVLTVAERGEAVELSVDYAEELFEASTVDRLLAGVETVVSAFTARPATPVTEVVLAGAADLAAQRAWNDTGVALPAEPVIHRAFARHAAATPDAPALEHTGEVLTYAELDALTNRLARALDVAPGERVLLLLDRGLHTVAGPLAVLKAGAAYVPLAPDYPKERGARVVAGSGARVVLTQARHRARVQEQWPGLRVVTVEEPAESAAPLGVEVSGDGPAYLMYTSGSTGEPKGVEITHHAFTSTVEAVRQRHFPGSGPLSTYSVTNYVFDIFGLEYGLTLLTGGRITVGDPWVTGLDCSPFDFVQMTPSLLELKLPDLRGTGGVRLLVGGEKLERRLLESALPRFAEVVNVYGPTETTIWSTTATYRGELAGPVTIGRALPNEGAHVLGTGLAPLPIGAVGELCLSGQALATGYAGDPGLTRARFVDTPLGRVYRTGDLARWLPEGELEFLGRVDNQVKLRGHRIELGEIDSALLACGARQAVTLVVDERLVGYHVGAEISAEQLVELLPEHMRPEVLIRLDALPLTHSGKLDRRALPVPAAEPAGFAAPSTDVEAVLAAAWCAVLGADRVGRHDRFFDLGGNSVSLTRVHGRLPADLRARVSVTDLFAHPTIAGLAAHLDRPAAAAPVTVRERSTVDRDIAVIGMACRFPDADTVEEYWHNLLAGKRSAVRHSREELLAAGVPERLLDRPSYVPVQVRMRDVGAFDAAFFGFSRRDAELMDPQQRVFLETAWHALEDAFHDPVSADAVGVFAGMGQNAYFDDHVRPALAGADPAEEYQAMIHSQANFLATKVAYRLDLTGPAITVQTACSSSLVAVHQAVGALLAGDCDVALAGGVSIGQLGVRGYLHQQGMVFSADGTCRAFDASATGTIEGQGAGIVVLKPLDRALADGDQVRAVIKASAVNNDGHDKVGYTAPSARQQAAVIAAAHRRAGITADTVGYVETHGTGTPLGDPIEFEGLRTAFGPGANAVLGAVKANIGHLDVASGVAGLIKAVLCLEHRTLVPTPGFEKPNPAIDLAGNGFRVGTEVEPWDSAGVRRAGVSSFGIGGTNAHVVLEEAPAVPRTPGNGRDRQLVVVSGRTPEAARRQAVRLAAHLPAELSRLSYTSLAARRPFEHGLVATGTTPAELAEALRVPAEPVPWREHRPVVFLFPGQGSQYQGMGRALYDSEPLFRSTVDECAAHLAGLGDGVADLLGWTARVGETEYTQPALFVLEYALARWFTAHGVRPAAMIGHSVGEYVAACLAGVFTLPEALRLVHTRGRLLARTAPGAMLAVPLPESEELLAGYALDVAAVNDHGSCVVAGTPEEVTRFAEDLAARGVRARRVPVSRAFHSRLLEPVLAEFERAVASVEPRKPELPFISGLTGDWADPWEVTQPRYWVDQLRGKVAFADGLGTLLTAEPTRHAAYAEIGPGRVLARLVRTHRHREDNPVTATQPRSAEGDARAEALTALGVLHVAGAPVDAAVLTGHGPADRVRLPGYAFDRTEHWIGRTAREEHAAPEPDGVATVEAVVEEAWRAVLGVAPASPHEDFFAQGGDSLAAVQLVARVERRLGVRLELLELPRPTPAALCAQLRARLAGLTGVGPRSVVRIRQGEDGVVPLVLVHPVGGDVYFYRELAQTLPESQPVYVIRSPMLDGLAEFDTIEDMAGHYLDLLAELDVRPPYRLGGSSFGGLVAYEMAREVAARHGLRPEVVLVDTPSPDNLPADMAEPEILDYLSRYGLSGLAFSQTELESLPTTEAKIRYLADRARGTVFEEMLAEDFLPTYLHVWRRHSAAMHRYRAQPYDGDLVFFSHQETIPEFPTGQDRFWRRLAQG
ncbi:non-ribosomal peptide synthetase/type I polyketide synthase, partial [Crossiella equi]